MAALRRSSFFFYGPSMTWLHKGSQLWLARPRKNNLFLNFFDSFFGLTLDDECFLFPDTNSKSTHSIVGEEPPTPQKPLHADKGSQELLRKLEVRVNSSVQILKLKSSQDLWHTQVSCNELSSFLPNPLDNLGRKHFKLSPDKQQVSRRRKKRECRSAKPQCHWPWLRPSLLRRTVPQGCEGYTSWLWTCTDAGGWLTEFWGFSRTFK